MEETVVSGQPAHFKKFQKRKDQFELSNRRIRCLRGTSKLIQLFSETLNVWATEIALVAFGVPALLEFGKRISGLESILAHSGFVTEVLRGLPRDGQRPPG